MKSNDPRQPERTSRGPKPSPRKSSYIISPPLGLSSLLSSKTAETHSILAVTALSHDSTGPEITATLKGAARNDVLGLEKWTHQKLSEIHIKYGDEDGASSNKESESTEQIKVLDMAIELLAKMIEMHDKDKARFVRKLWTSSADLFNGIYQELTTVIQDLRLKLSEKAIHCSKLEEVIERLHAANASKTEQEEKRPVSRATAQQNNQMQEVTATIRALEEEIVLRNQNVLELQNVITKLSMWFPNFTRFSESILTKYLPPVDVLEEARAAERERRVKARKEEDRLRAEQVSKAGEGRTHRGQSFLGAIGESGDDIGRIRDNDLEAEDLSNAQSYLLKDLKRLQGIGIGFAVLDPGEFEAATRAVEQNLNQSTSAGSFASSQQSNSATTPINFPKAVLDALGRTSTNVSKKYHIRKQNVHSFIEVEGEEYNLRAGVYQSPTTSTKQSPSSLNSPVSSSGFASPSRKTASKSAKSIHPALVEDDNEDRLGDSGSRAGSASASSRSQRSERGGPHSGTSSIRAAMEAAVEAVNGPAVNIRTPAPEPLSPNAQEKKNMLSPPPETSASPVELTEEAAAAGVKISRTIAKKLAHKKLSIVPLPPSELLKREDSFTGTRTRGNTEDFGTEDDGNGIQQRDRVEEAAYMHAVQVEREYEAKYRALLLDAQRLERERANAEKKLKDDAKSHHKQLLRMTAQITLLQNKLTASTLSAVAMQQKIPHVVFPPLLPRSEPTGPLIPSTRTAPDHPVDPSSLVELSRLSVDDGVLVVGEDSVQPLAGGHGDGEDGEYFGEEVIVDDTRQSLSVLLNNCHLGLGRSMGTASFAGTGGEGGKRGSVTFEDTVAAPPDGSYTHPPQHFEDSTTSALSRYLLEVEASQHTVGTAPPSPPAPGSRATQRSKKERVMRLHDIEKLIIQFTAHFVQAAPLVSNPKGGAGATSSSTSSAPPQTSTFTSHVTGAMTGSDGTSAPLQSRQTASGVSVRDELFSIFGTGPDQWTKRNLSSVLNGQQATLLIAKVASAVGVSLPSSSPAAAALMPLSPTVACGHLLQYLAGSASISARSRSQQRSSTAARAAHKLWLLQQSVVLLQHRFSSTEPATVPTLPHRHISAFLHCMHELLFGSHFTSPSLSALSPLFHQRIYFELFATGFGAMQRQFCPLKPPQCLSNTPGTIEYVLDVLPRTFPVTATERVLKRIFLIVRGSVEGEEDKLLLGGRSSAKEGPGSPLSSPSSTRMRTRSGAQSLNPHSRTSVEEDEHAVAPWWRCVTESFFEELKVQVERAAIVDRSPVPVHKAAEATVSPLERAGSSTSVGDKEDGEADVAPMPLVNCYDCIRICFAAAAEMHRKLTGVLKNMFRFMKSLAIANGVSSNTFHLLLAHYLQQEYPTVKECAQNIGTLTISAITDGTFNFAPRTAVVVNLELMNELIQLDAGPARGGGVGSEGKQSRSRGGKSSVGERCLTDVLFADAVLRSQPNYLVHSLLPLLADQQSPYIAIMRVKLIAEGNKQLETLRNMLERALQARQTLAPQPSVALVSPPGNMDKGMSDVSRGSVHSSAGGSVMLGSAAESHNSGHDSGLTTNHMAREAPSHFKKSFLVNQFLYAEEVPVVRRESTSTSMQHAPVHDTTMDSVRVTASGFNHQAEPDDFDVGILVREVAGAPAGLWDAIEAPPTSQQTAVEDPSEPSPSSSPVTLNPLIQRLLLHSLLSYDENIAASVMEPSLTQLTFTTWTLQYVVETMSRLRGSSMRLKKVMRKDLLYVGGAPLTAVANKQGDEPAGSSSSSKGGAPSSKAVATVLANQPHNVGSIGDYVLMDLLLDDTVDFDSFLRVEAHYLKSLQRRAFRAWSARVEAADFNASL